MNIGILGIRGIPANYGGFETCAEQTAVRFAREHEVYVFCRRHNATVHEPTYRGVRLVTLPSINRKHVDTPSHTFAATIYLLMRPRIRVVHLYNTANAIFVPLLRLFGKKVVVSVDGLEWKRAKWRIGGKPYYRFAEWLCARFAHRIVADSTVIQRYYRERWNVEAEYIPYGSPEQVPVGEEILEEYALRPGGYLLFVGRLVPEKGVHRLIEAFRDVRTEMPLVIVGDDDKHADYVAGLKRSPDARVRFVGSAYGPKYDALNRHAYLYVTASEVEGTSPALLGAMAAGRCVVVNGTEENRETIGDAGFGCRENDVVDLRETLQRLVDQPDLVRAYGQRARAHALARYDWNVVARQYLDVFASTLTGRVQNDRNPSRRKASA